jgi:hypothetical protein
LRYKPICCTFEATDINKIDVDHTTVDHGDSWENFEWMRTYCMWLSTFKGYSDLYWLEGVFARSVQPLGSTLCGSNPAERGDGAEQQGEPRGAGEVVEQ